MTSCLIDTASRAWHAAGAFLRDRVRSHGVLREVEQLTPEDQARIFGEYGLTHEEFAAGMRRPFASQDLLSAAMRALGIDRTAVTRQDAGLERDMRRVCMGCRHRLRCHGELERAAFASRYPFFCLNRGSFAQIRRSRQPVS